jgi:hypothetical protein
MERTVKVQLLQMSMKLELPMFDSDLMNTFSTFTQSKDAILILDGYMMALMHDINSFFYLFNPHTRNSFRKSDPNGTEFCF